MPHVLKPNSQTPDRTLDELLDVLRDEFAVFHSNRDRGDQHVDQMIAHWQRMLNGYRRWKEPPPQAADLESQIGRFASLRGNAAFVVVGDDDDEDLVVSFNLIPREEILIGYANQTHQQKATPVSLRVAAALGYDAALV